MAVGDIIYTKPKETFSYLRGSRWHGFKLGYNTRTGKMGRFNVFKTKPLPNIVRYPSYPEVPN